MQFLRRWPLRYSVTASTTECLIPQFNVLQSCNFNYKAGCWTNKLGSIRLLAITSSLSLHGILDKMELCHNPPLSPCFTMQTKPGACRHVAHAITRQTKKSEFASSSPTSTAGRLRVGASPLPEVYLFYSLVTLKTWTWISAQHRHIFICFSSINMAYIFIFILIYL